MLAQQYKVTVIHIFKDNELGSKMGIEEEQEENLSILKTSYNSSRFKYYASGKCLAKGMKLAKKNNGSIDKIFLNVFFPLGAHLPWISKLYKAPIYAIEHWTGYHKSIPTFNPDHKHLKVAKWASKYCEKVFGVSRNLNEAMLSNGLQNVEGVVYNSVNQKLFNLVEEKNGTFKWLHISSLKDEHKNFRMLLKAFTAVTQNNKAELVVINSGDEMPYKDLIEQLGVKVKFHGAQSIEGVAAIMKTCHAFVLSSNYENMPCVIAEALCCGLPSVSTDVGGISEVINESNGILVPKGNTIRLAKAMEEVQTHFERFEPISISKEAIGKFGSAAVLEQLENVLEL